MSENKLAAEPTELKMFETDGQICRIRFTRDGQYLLSSGHNADLRRWTLDGPDEEVQLVPAGEIRGHRGWVQAFALHPSEPWVVSADSWGQVRCTNYQDEAPQTVWAVEDAHDGWIRDVAISADGARVATAARDRIVRVWDAGTGKKVAELAGHEHEVYSVAFHPDNQQLASADLFARVRHWNIERQSSEREFAVESMHFYERIQDVCGLRILQFSADGEMLRCAGADPTKAGRSYGVPSIHLVDWKSGEVRQSLQQGETKDGFVFDLDWHPDGYFMMVTSGTPGSGNVFFRRPEDDSPWFTLNALPNCHSLALHPDGTRFMVAATNRRNQGNGAVLDKEGNYVPNWSPLHLFALPRS